MRQYESSCADERVASAAGVISSGRSFGEVIAGKLNNALRSLGVGQPESADFRRAVQELIGDWAHQPVESGSRHEYFAANDGAPFEFSFAWSGRGVEIRFGCESAVVHSSPRARQDAATELIRRLSGYPGAALQRYLSVEDLFVTPRPRQPFSILQAVAWRPGGQPTFKIYVNPAANGRGAAAATVSAALGRLGAAAAWRVVTQRLSRSDLNADLAIFALDLTDSGDARTKVYLNCPERYSADDIERIAELSPAHRPGKVPEALDIIYGSRNPALRKSCMICLSFTSAADTIVGMNLYLPLDPNVPNDAEACAVVSSLMRHEGIDPSGHEAVLAALGTTSLRGSRMQSWVSCQVVGDPRVTVYIGPELYRKPILE